MSATLPSAKPQPVMVVCLGALDERAARALVTDEGQQVYEVVVLADVRLRDDFEARDVLLWWNGSDTLTMPMQELGDRLARDTSRAVKYLTPTAPGIAFGPHEAVTDCAWGWAEFYAWAKPLVRIWSTAGFRAAVAAFEGRATTDETDDALQPDVPDEAAEQALASVTESPLPEFDGSVDEPPQEETRSERSQTFHVEPNAEGWPAPMDLWGSATLPIVERHMLPDQIADYMLDQCALAGVDPAQAAVSCMVASAGLIRESMSLQMMADSPRWQEKARLWGAIMGDPSTRKGVGIEIGDSQLRHIALRFRAAEEKATAEYGSALKDYEAEMTTYRRKRKEAGAQRPELPERPLSNRLWTDDATLEALGKLLSSHARGKLTVIRDELAGWFGSFDAYSNGKGDKDRPVYLSAYEGKERYIDRSNAGSAFYVPTWSLCILGGIQPSVIAKIAEKLGDDGMLQRFMVVASRPSGKSEERQPNHAAVTRWQRICENLLNLDPHPNGPVRLSRPAQEFRAECSDWIDNAQRAGLSPQLQAALGKYEGLFGRLMLTAHCIQTADTERQIPDAEVSLKVARQCWAYIKDFLWPHALHFYEAGMTEGDDRGPVKWVAGAHILTGMKEIGTTYLSRNYFGYRGLKTHAQRKAFLNSLVNAGWIRPIGREMDLERLPTRYEVNPAANDGRFDAVAKRYAAQRKRYAELMEMGREPGQD